MTPHPDGPTEIPPRLLAFARAVDRRLDRLRVRVALALGLPVAHGCLYEAVDRALTADLTVVLHAADVPGRPILVVEVVSDRYRASCLLPRWHTIPPHVLPHVVAQVAGDLTDGIAAHAAHELLDP